MRGEELGPLLIYAAMGFLSILVVVAATLSARRKDRPRKEAARRKIGEALGGRYSDGAILLEIGGREARIDFVETGVERSPRTCVSVDLRGVSPGALRVVPRDAPGTVRLFGVLLMPGGRSGASEFDQAYEIHGTPPSVAESFFAAPRREWVIQTLRGLERLGEPALEIARERLLVRVHRDLEDERSIRHLVTVASVLFEYIADAVPGGVAWMEAGAGKDARCGVCMAAMETSVACARCRAPHHRDCWEFTGLCSTFACGSRQCA